MIIFAERQPHLTAKVGNAMRFWYRCRTDDGRFEDNVLVDVSGTSSETVLDADVRMAVASAFSSALGSLFLATDVRIR